MDSSPNIRWMLHRDMSSVIEIENKSFDDPWSAQEFSKTLMSRNSGLVAEVNKSIAGFVVYELHKTHLVISNLAVAPEFKRQGIGKAIIDRLKDKLSVSRRWFIEACVRETNLQAQLFFRSMDFRAKFVKDYFTLKDGNYESCCMFRFQHCEAKSIYEPANRIGSYYQVDE